jgi:hypothetical protein
MMVQTLARSVNNVNSVRYNAEYYAHLTLGDDQLNNFPRKLPDPIHVDVQTDVRQEGCFY